MSASASASWTPWGEGGSYCAACGNYTAKGTGHQCDGGGWRVANTTDWTSLYLAQIVGLLSKLVDQTAPIFEVEEVQYDGDAKFDREFANGCGVGEPEPFANTVKLALLSARRKLSRELTERRQHIAERQRFLEQDQAWVDGETIAVAEIEGELATRGVVLTDDPAADELAVWEQVYGSEPERGAK